jgi:membrane fusion protein, heavy metal efflux system
MMGRLSLLIVALVGGMALAIFVPGLSQWIRAAIPFSETAGTTPEVRDSVAGGRKPSAETADGQGLVKLTEDEVEAAGIEVAVAQSGAVAHRIVVPGTIVPNADRIAHVAVKLSGTLAELRKKVGDPVAANEVLAILESREVAEAKSEYLAARLTSELAKDLYERDQVLWDKRVTSEQLLLRSRSAAAQARMKIDIARQKLIALGLSEAEIAALPNEPEALLRRQEVRSPIAGRVVERKVELGMAVGRDSLETELFVVADLDVVWVELAVSPADLSRIREGQVVSITSRDITDVADGKIIFISPMLDKETRFARVVAELANSSGAWRPGSFATAAIAFEEEVVSIVVPTNAIQTMGAGAVAFVRTSDGFQKRQVILGKSDDRVVEVVSGLRAGDTIAMSNTFLLKAELLKALAED